MIIISFGVKIAQNIHSHAILFGQRIFQQNKTLIIFMNPEVITSKSYSLMAHREL